MGPARLTMQLSVGSDFSKGEVTLDEVQRNIAIVRRLEDAFNGRNYFLLREIIASAFEGHNPGSNDVTVEGLAANNEDWHAALPDKRTEIVASSSVKVTGSSLASRIAERIWVASPGSVSRPTARQWTWMAPDHAT